MYDYFGNISDAYFTDMTKLVHVYCTDTYTNSAVTQVLRSV